MESKKVKKNENSYKGVDKKIAIFFISRILPMKGQCRGMSGFCYVYGCYRILQNPYMS